MAIGGTLTIVRGVWFPSGVQSKQPGDGQIACLRTTNVQSVVEWSDLWFIPRTYLRRSEQIVEAGDILISTANSLNLVGKVALVTEQPHEATLGAFIALIRVPTELDRRFIYYQLSSYLIQSEIRKRASTTTNISNVSIKRLSEVELQIPPLPEQRRIVAEIEKQFTRLDAATAALVRARANLRRYRAAVLAAACEGRLVPTEAELARAEGREYESNQLDGWCPTSGNDLFQFVTSGSRGWAKYYSKRGAAFFRMGNLDHSSISLDRSYIQRVSPPADAEGSRTRVCGGDLLISITADVGMVAVIEDSVEEAYINQHLALARPKGGVNARYLGWALVSRVGQDQFDRLRRGATKVGLGLDDIRNLVVNLPPLPEQDRIVAEVERRLSLVEKLEAVVDDALKRAAALRQSILKRAFEGKLVPQDPDDEPADVLLDRIRAERAAQASNGPKPKRAPRKEARP